MKELEAAVGPFFGDGGVVAIDAIAGKHARCGIHSSKTDWNVSSVEVLCCLAAAGIPAQLFGAEKQVRFSQRHYVCWLNGVRWEAILLTRCAEQFLIAKIRV